VMLHPLFCRRVDVVNKENPKLEQIAVSASKRLCRCEPQWRRRHTDSRPGNDFTPRFPLIAEALASLRSRSCIIDGEAVACDDNGVASFDLVRHHRANDSVFLYAFDLIELNGDDLRRDPLEVRKATLASVLAKAGPGIRFNEHIEGDTPTVFAHARKMGLEDIVSKRKDSAYRSGRSPDWLKMKNPEASAVKREAEEDWGRWGWRWRYGQISPRAALANSRGPEWTFFDRSAGRETGGRGRMGENTGVGFLHAQSASA
jgi:bifunctional non-homologous end joining protein LigD